MREYLVAVGAWGTEPIYAEPAWSDAWPSVCTMLGAAGSSSPQVGPQDKIFHAFNVDGNGRIDAAEIEALASRLGQRWTSQQTVAVMNEMNSDGGGTVDAAEFKAWFFGRHLQLASFRAYHTAYRHGCLRTDLRRLRAQARFRPGPPGAVEWPSRSPQ
jgi:hypothetical protein